MGNIVKAPNGQLVCDFCSSPNPTAGYIARSFVLESPVYGVDDYGSNGGWVACDSCAALINANDREGLTARSNKLFRERDRLGAEENRKLDRWRGELHRLFFSHVVGNYELAALTDEQNKWIEEVEETLTLTNMVREDHRGDPDWTTTMNNVENACLTALQSIVSRFRDHDEYRRETLALLQELRKLRSEQLEPAEKEGREWPIMNTEQLRSIAARTRMLGYNRQFPAKLIFRLDPDGLHVVAFKTPHHHIAGKPAPVHWRTQVYVKTITSDQPEAIFLDISSEDMQALPTHKGRASGKQPQQHTEYVPIKEMDTFVAEQNRQGNIVEIPPLEEQPEELQRALRKLT